MSQKQKGKQLRSKAVRLLKKEHKNWKRFHIDTKRKFIKAKIKKLKESLKVIQSRQDFNKNSKKLVRDYNYDNPKGYRNKKKVA